MTILKEQVLAVTNRRAEHVAAEAYYEGTVDEKFSSPLLRKAFANNGYRAKLNFCRPVVDAVYNRLEISAVQGTSTQANEVINQVWNLNELDLDADEIHRRALVFGECFVMLWPDEDGNFELSYNTPLTTAIVYDPERPRKKAYAVKMWETEDGTRMNIYTDKAITKYKAEGKSVTEGTNWSQIGTVDNPFGEIPVFHFRTERPKGRPEHVDAYDSQDYINKQFITSMYVTDYQGAPQRYALAKAGVGGEVKDFAEGDTDRENVGSLKNGPGELWVLDGMDKVGEFKPADPANFWTPIKDTVRSMASLTNTPLHYFEKTGNVPSGEALRVAEAPLMKKVERRKASFGQTWKEIFEFILRASGVNESVQVKWEAIESLDELERWDLALKERNAGVSLQQVLRERGYDQEVIEQVMEEATAERDTGQVAGYERAVRTQPQNDERNVENNE